MIAIVAGGIWSERLLPDIRRADIVIGVDRGAIRLIKRGVVPYTAVGDFDSVTPAEKRRIRSAVTRYIEHPAKKNATDLELAIDEAIRLTPTGVTIYGALGKRFDHAIAATQLLLKLESHNISGQIVDNFNKINIVRRLHRIARDPRYRYVSIIPLEQESVVTLKGFVYELTNVTIRFGSTLSVSNEIAGSSATVRIHQGLALLIQSNG